MCRNNCNHGNKQKQIVSHVDKLAKIFPHIILGSDSETKTLLYYQLDSLERKAHKLAERYCNGEIDTNSYNAQEARILDRLDTLLGFRALNIPVFVNGDPRGYALKIDDSCLKVRESGIEMDWGGYGIIAPEF